MTQDQTRGGLYDDQPYGLEAVFADIATLPQLRGINFEFGKEFTDDPGTTPKVVFCPSPDDDPEGPNTDALAEVPQWQRVTTESPVRIDGAKRNPAGALSYVPAFEDAPMVLVAHSVSKGSSDLFRVEIQSIPRVGLFSSMWNPGNPAPPHDAVPERKAGPVPAVLLRLPVGRDGQLFKRRSEVLDLYAAHPIASRLLRVSAPDDGDAVVGLSKTHRYRSIDTRRIGGTLYLYEENETLLSKLLNLMWVTMRNQYQASFEARAASPMEHQSTQSSWGMMFPFIIRVPIYEIVPTVQIRSTHVDARGLAEPAVRTADGRNI